MQALMFTAPLSFHGPESPDRHCWNTRGFVLSSSNTHLVLPPSQAGGKIRLATPSTPTAAPRWTVSRMAVIQPSLPHTIGSAAEDKVQAKRIRIRRPRPAPSLHCLAARRRRAALGNQAENGPTRRARARAMRKAAGGRRAAAVGGNGGGPASGRRSAARSSLEPASARAGQGLLRCPHRCPRFARQLTGAAAGARRPAPLPSARDPAPPPCGRCCRRRSLRVVHGAPLLSAGNLGTGDDPFHEDWRHWAGR